MKKIFRNILAVSAFLGLALTSCNDKVEVEPQGGVKGVNRNEMVEVTLPFLTNANIEKTIVTRADVRDAAADSYMKNMLVLIYEAIDVNDPSVNRLISYNSYENATQGNGNGWKYDGANKSRGTVKFTIPTGDVYIYLIANYDNSFMRFFGDLSKDQLNTMLMTQQGFFDAATPKWTGNMDAVDGFMPLFGMVNNRDGLCHVTKHEKTQTSSSTGFITFTDIHQKACTIASAGIPSAENAFQLKRLMTKVTMKFISPKDKPNASAEDQKKEFIPERYAVRYAAQYASPVRYVPAKEGTVDTEFRNFNTQTPNEFTIYLPENIKVGNKELNKTFQDRDKAEKTADKKNVMETDGIHYKFVNAPANSTYIEIIGHFNDENRVNHGDEDVNETTKITSDTRYLIHLGDFGKTDEQGNQEYQNFSLQRDHHYTYKVTVNGVDDIRVEVGTNAAPGTENQPAVEGMVYYYNLKADVDAHYDQVEIKFIKGKAQAPIVLHATTPFGNATVTYTPSTQTFKPMYPENITKEDAKKYFTWVKFKKQKEVGSRWNKTAKNNLALYGADVQDIFKALDDFWSRAQNETEDSYSEYWTCFVNEYYYETNPLTGGTVTLKEFINKPDRVFSISSDLRFSEDEESAVTKSVYMIEQKAIACFYDLNNKTQKKYGVESVSEDKGLSSWGVSKNDGVNDEFFDGRSNTLTAINLDWGGSRNDVNWAKNGWLLDKDEQNYVEGARMNNGYVLYSFLSRNRDLNGNGTLEENEIKWYIPAVNQVFGMWVGEAALPRTAAVYQGNTQDLGTDQDFCQRAIFTSNGGGDRIVWGEQGCSTGNIDGAGTGQAGIIAVRNLGVETADGNSYQTAADPFYSYDPNTRTIELYLSDLCLRGYTDQELVPHHERSRVNMPYRKMQVASRFAQETMTADKAYIEPTTSLLNYTEGDQKKDWRLPNQRELAVMFMAMPHDLDLNRVGTTTKGHVIVCRTAFSNSQFFGNWAGQASGWYTPYGFCYQFNEEKDGHICMLYKDIWGYAHKCLGVRDVK